MKWLLVMIALVARCDDLRAQEVDPMSGNWWLEQCEVELSPMCTGFVAGMMSVNELLAHVNQQVWCEPPGVILAQRLRVIVLDLKNNPAELHQPFAALAIRAMRRAFPCPDGKGLVLGKR